MTKETTDIARFQTGVRNLDALLKGGLPRGTVTVLAGPPGAGKTILAQQICFHNASPEARVLYFITLSEPAAKTLRYLSQFRFFDQRKLESEVQFVDLGAIFRAQGLEEASGLMMEHVRRSSRRRRGGQLQAFDDLVTSHELRKFSYEIAVNLMAWEATTSSWRVRTPASRPTRSSRSSTASSRSTARAVRRAAAFRADRQDAGDRAQPRRALFHITSNGIEVFAPRHHPS